jgi:hypothetical protein
MEAGMCECSCGDFNPTKLMKVGENILAVEIYPGCQECNTGIIFGLHILTEEEAVNRGLEIDDIFEFRPDEFGYSQVDFPLLSGDDLASASEEQKGIFDYYDDPSKYLRGNGVYLLQRAMDIRKKINDGDNR